MSKRESQKKEWEGKTIMTNCSGAIDILEYRDSRNVVVKFVNTGHVKIVTSGHLRTGEIKDNSLSSLFGITLKTFPNAWLNHNKEYRLWIAMHERCYSEKLHKVKPCYEGCTTSENFKDFLFFLNWKTKQVGHDREGWHLDKDLIIRGNREYSEHSCCFVPHEINTLTLSSKKTRGELPIGVDLTKQGAYSASVSKQGKNIKLGVYNTIEEAFLVYKQTKESYIKEIANKWKDQIDNRVYNSLVNWIINIDD